MDDTYKAPYSADYFNTLRNNSIKTLFIMPLMFGIIIFLMILLSSRGFTSDSYKSDEGLKICIIMLSAFFALSEILNFRSALVINKQKSLDLYIIISNDGISVYSEVKERYYAEHLFSSFKFYSVKITKKGYAIFFLHTKNSQKRGKIMLGGIDDYDEFENELSKYLPEIGIE